MKKRLVQEEDVSLCSIAEYFYGLGRILTSSKGESKYKQRENLSTWSSGEQIPRDIYACFGRYLYSKKCSEITIYNYYSVHDGAFLPPVPGSNHEARVLAGFVSMYILC